MNQLLWFLILLISSLLIVLLIIFAIAWSAKTTLIRGGVAWSAKELPLKRRKGKSEGSLLSEIDQTSTDFLKAQINDEEK